MSESSLVGARPRLSFIVPVRDQAERLAGCLDAIRSSVGKGGHVELIVIDNGSEDGSPEVAAERGARVEVRRGATVGGLRNLGASIAAADILVFVDSDVEIESDWCDRVLAQFDASPGVTALAGTKSLPPRPSWVQRAYWHLSAFPASPADVRWLRSGCLALRREAFESVGGFDDRLRTCEDQDLCNRLRARGCRLRFEPELRWLHLGDPETLGQLFRGELWRGRDNLGATLRAGRSVRELVSLVYPAGQLALLLAAVAGIVLGGSWGVQLSLAAAGLFACGGLLRAARVSLAETTTAGSGRFSEILAVSLIHDLARALALVVRPGYHRRSS